MPLGPTKPNELVLADGLIDAACEHLARCSDVYSTCDQILSSTLLERAQELRQTQSRMWRDWHDHTHPNL